MLTIVPVLCLFALIQSIYGVGLLVFGTPFLLLNNFGFDQILGFLLPSSLMISLHQVWAYREKCIKETQLIPFALTGLPIGLLIVFYFDKSFKIMPVVGIALLLAALIRTSQIALNVFIKLLQKFNGYFHFLNAFIHGVSNLGGALLPVYSTSIYKDKTLAVKCTATFYAIYSSAQIFLLFLMEKWQSLQGGVLILPVCFICYWIGGRYSIKIISQKLFDRLALVLFWCIGLILIYRGYVF